MTYIKILYYYKSLANNKQKSPRFRGFHMNVCSRAKYRLFLIEEYSLITQQLPNSSIIHTAALKYVLQFLP